MSRKSDDLLWAQKLTIGLQPTVWRSVAAALRVAQSKTTEQRFLNVIPGAMLKVSAVLKAFDSRPANYSKGEPILDVESTVFGWVTLSELLLQYGDEMAKCPAGRTMVVACSQVIYGGADRKGDSDAA